MNDTYIVSKMSPEHYYTLSQNVVYLDYILQLEAKIHKYTNERRKIYGAYVVSISSQNLLLLI